MITKRIVIVLMVVMFLVGLAVLVYPHYQGAKIEDEMESEAISFLESVQSEPSTETEEAPNETPPMPTEKERKYPELWEDMNSYNETIYAEEQAGLKNKASYRNPSFLLSDYGLESEVFGVVQIPKLEIQLPIYLGATTDHMSKGAAHLSQTSLPIGGKNTNCVIAGHCGWEGAAYFRYISELKPGDEIFITNLWETLTYTVTESKIIEPNETDNILIQEGRDMLTLLTCHPYASGGRQRLLVFCDREKGEINGTN